MAIPERNMIEFARKMALLETSTSMLGKLKFIWATTVLLGGFASSLSLVDFLSVSVILAFEGIRIFGEHQTSYSSSGYARKVYQVLQQSVVLPISSLGVGSAEDVPTVNQFWALQIFYCASLFESVLILLETSLLLLLGLSRGNQLFCWARWISRRVLEVKEGYNLNDSQINTLYRFLYNTYSRCLRGGVLGSLKITIVSYSVELLQSSDGDEQLNGATLLWGLVKENPRALEKLRSIGTIRSVVEMLIDMLNWDSNELTDQKIRVAAAEIIFNLVGIGRNRTLVMAAPDSMESIASLLYDGNQLENNFEYRKLSRLGLCILKQLANEHDNRDKMGSNRGLLLKIITLTESNTPELDLRKLAIETLTSIARDQDFREIIGCIDEVLHNFFSLFVDTPIGNEGLVPKAGEALGFLLLNNNQNSEIMESIRRAYFRNLIPRLISLLNEEERGTYAAIILRNLSAYLEAYLEAHPNENIVELNMIGTAAAQVVDLVTEKEGVDQEAAIGLAAQIFKFLSQADYGRVMREPRAGLLISTLLYVLRQHASRELPNIRRFSILLLIAIMRMDIRIIARELIMDLRNALEGAMNTTSVLESYSTFSGTIGLRSDSMAIPFLARSAIELLDN